MLPLAAVNVVEDIVTMLSVTAAAYRRLYPPDVRLEEIAVTLVVVAVPA
jgi:hypothetical protein